MPDIFDLLRRWWKPVTGVVLLSLLAVGIITFLKPRQYLSVATAVPASSMAADKGRIFNENIQELYSALGYPDDLDKVVGTAALDTVYLAVAAAFNLYDHYKIKDEENALLKSARELKSNSTVLKSDYGELKIKVWDTDKNLAPQLANAILANLDALHRDLQNAGNQASLKALEQRLQTIRRTSDSATADQKIKLLAEAAGYEKLINEYHVLAEAKPPVLITVEKAKPALHPDRPQRLKIMLATAAFSFLFAILAALAFDSKRQNDQQ